jgi:hypothetical protein
MYRTPGENYIYKVEFSDQAKHTRRDDKRNRPTVILKDLAFSFTGFTRLAWNHSRARVNVDGDAQFAYTPYDELADVFRFDGYTTAASVQHAILRYIPVMTVDYIKDRLSNLRTYGADAVAIKALRTALVADPHPILRKLSVSLSVENIMAGRPTDRPSYHPDFCPNNANFRYMCTIKFVVPGMRGHFIGTIQNYERPKGEILSLDDVMPSFLQRAFTTLNYSQDELFEDETSEPDEDVDAETASLGSGSDAEDDGEDGFMLIDVDDPAIGDMQSDEEYFDLDLD